MRPRTAAVDVTPSQPHLADSEPANAGHVRVTIETGVFRWIDQDSDSLAHEYR